MFKLISFCLICYNLSKHKIYLSYYENDYNFIIAFNFMHIICSEELM